MTLINLSTILTKYEILHRAIFSYIYKKRNTIRFMEEKACKITRWQLLKNQLNNLEYHSFVEQFKSDPNSIIYDVRTEVEYECGHLEGALNLDYFGTQFLEVVENLDPEQNYYIYCRSGRRSSRVCLILKNAGFQNVFNLDGGLKSVEIPETSNTAINSISK